MVPVDLYKVFYMPLAEVTSWAPLRKENRIKDLFLARYRLPLHGRSIFPLPVVPQEAYGPPARHYLPVHVEIATQRTVTFFLDGADKGTLSVNGEKKASFDLRGEPGYVESRLSFAPGVYAVLFTVEKTRPSIPLLLWADQKITLSERGFTKKFSASVTVAVRPVSEVFDRLWLTRCLPAPEDSKESRAIWNTVFCAENEYAINEEKTPLILLLRRSDRPEIRARLRKWGFTEEMLDWWITWFSEREVCSSGGKEF